MKILLLLVSLLSFINVIYCAKILVVYPMPSNSHYILGTGIVRPLVEAGHDITFISPYKAKNVPKNGTWTDVVVTSISIVTEEENSTLNSMFDVENMSPYFMLLFMNEITSKTAEATLEDKNVQALLNSAAQFDVVIMENFALPALHGLAHHFNASLILVNSIHPRQWINWLVGNPAPPSYVPELFLSYSKEMTFFQRVNNVLYQLVAELNNQLVAYPRQQKILKKFFPNAPPLEDLLYNASLVFVNTNLATSQPIPKVPAMIDIGGYHMPPVKKLPKDLQQFLDNAKDGVIYFSMGSVLKSAEMSQANKDAFLKVFSKLKQKVLWKWEEDNLPGQPPNVKTGKWLPQNDILAHPNVKLFITHGGFTSTTETLYHGVPVLAIPIFGDQKANAAQAVFDGYGLSLPYSSVNEENLTKIIRELVNNPKYTENAKTRSKIFKDQITTPQQRIRFWVEYVARHKGASHLRVEGLKLPWYKYLVLDVFAFLISCFVIFILVVRYIVKKLFRKNKSKSKVKTN